MLLVNRIYLPVINEIFGDPLLLPFKEIHPDELLYSTLLFLFIVICASWWYFPLRYLVYYPDIWIINKFKNYSEDIVFICKKE